MHRGIGWGNDVDDLILRVNAVVLPRRGCVRSIGYKMDINGMGKMVEQFGLFERAKIGAAADFVCVKYAIEFIAYLIKQIVFKDKHDFGISIGTQRRAAHENAVEGGVFRRRSLRICFRFGAAEGDVKLIFILLAQRQEKRCTAAGIHKTARVGKCDVLGHGRHLIF